MADAGVQVLRVHALFRLPALAELLPGVAEVRQRHAAVLTQTYHDSEDLRLFRWGVSLQRRTGDDFEGWQLDMPEQATAEQLRLPLGDAAPGHVPAELRDVVAALLREADLVPVATLRTERTSHLLIGRRGVVVAELLDDTVSILDGEHVAARFRQLQVVPLAAEGVDADAPAGDAADAGTGADTAAAAGDGAQAGVDADAPAGDAADAGTGADTAAAAGEGAHAGVDADTAAAAGDGAQAGVDAGAAADAAAAIDTAAADTAAPDVTDADTASDPDPDAADADAPEDTAAALLDLLLEQGAVPESGSAIASALGPRAAAPADVVLRGPVHPQDPAGAAVRAHLALQVTRFLLQDTRVRRDLPDSVHQMRVAARRLRSGLKVFGPLVDPEWSLHLRTELGWAAGELGRVRDTEVMLARLDDHADELPPADSQLATQIVERVLKADLAEARGLALDSLRSRRHAELLVALVEAVHHPHLTDLAQQPCTDVLPPMVAKSFRRLSRDVAGLHIDSVAEPWHETRIAAKKARYAAELVAPVFGEPAKRLAKALADVTENLGDHQDCHVAQQELRRISLLPDVDGATGFALGLLHAAEEERELSLREDFTMIWPPVQRLFRKTELS